MSFAQQNVGGIGAQLFLDTAGGFTMPRIQALVPNSPAYAKLNATDYIMKVNDVSCKDKTIEEIVAMIRGEAGTSVKITVADTKQGKRERDVELVRVGLQIPGNNAPAPDPVAAFNERCENEVKQLKKQRYEIVKTASSECGNFFFNFEAAANQQYHIRAYTLEVKSKGQQNPAFYATARVFDGDNEAGATTLAKAASTTAGNTETAQSEGTVTFPKNCIGVVSMQLHDDATKCSRMFIVVYK